MEAVADLVATLHLAYFLFIVCGFFEIVAGARRGWRWIYNPWFRITHLFAVMVVVAEDVFHFPCALKLNALERHLHQGDANGVPEPSAISAVMDLLLRHTIPGWFLDAMYWTMGVVLSMLVFLLPPRFVRRGRVDAVSKSISPSSSMFTTQQGTRQRGLNVALA